MLDGSTSLRDGSPAAKNCAILNNRSMHAQKMADSRRPYPRQALHCVVAAQAAPEKVMDTFKAYQSRNLDRTGLDTKDRKRWTRHGSTRYLWMQVDVMAAIDYVINQQGEPMEIYLLDPLPELGE